jgi:hypothetical protein
VIIQNSSRGPATKANVDSWVSAYACNYDVVLDPTGGKSIFPGTGGTIGLPYNLIVDPRTMKITKIIQGDGSSVDYAVKALLTANGG